MTSVLSVAASKFRQAGVQAFRITDFAEQATLATEITDTAEETEITETHSLLTLFAPVQYWPNAEVVF